MSNTVYPQALAAMRAMAGLSLRQLSEEAGVSKSHLSDIELGRRIPSPGVAKKIARALGVPMASFFVIGPKQPTGKDEVHVA